MYICIVVRVCVCVKNVYMCVFILKINPENLLEILDYIKITLKSRKVRKSLHIYYLTR